MTDPSSEDELADLMARLARPSPAPSQPTTTAQRPIYLLEVDGPDDRSIVLIVRTSADGVMRATISLPDWHELPEGWDGPHTMDVAIPLANSYAEAYGYTAIAIDIESSQLWDDAWGPIDKAGDRISD